METGKAQNVFNPSQRRYKPVGNSDFKVLFLKVRRKYDILTDQNVGKTLITTGAGIERREVRLDASLRSVDNEGLRGSIVTTCGKHLSDHEEQGSLNHDL